MNREQRRAYLKHIKKLQLEEKKKAIIQEERKKKKEKNNE